MLSNPPPHTSPLGACGTSILAPIGRSTAGLWRLDLDPWFVNPGSATVTRHRHQTNQAVQK